MRGATSRISPRPRSSTRPAFPFPHLLEVSVAAHDDRLVDRHPLVPTGDRRSRSRSAGTRTSVSPGTPRARWTLRLPAASTSASTIVGIPTVRPGANSPRIDTIGRRTFDDLYRLGRDRRLAFTGDDGAYRRDARRARNPFAQVWVPAGMPFAALEPMAVPTNALVTGTRTSPLPATPSLRPLASR